MNLYKIAFQALSCHETDSFYEDIGKQMPRHLLKEAVRKNLSLRDFQEETEMICNFMEKNNDSRKIWQNPEIYVPLSKLIQPISDSAEIKLQLELLKLHLGIISIYEAIALPPNYYRLSHIDDSVYLNLDGSVSQVQEVLSFSLNNFCSYIYLPKDKLFNDFLPNTLYPRTEYSYEISNFFSLISESSGILNDYCQDLSSDFRQMINTLVLTPDIGHLERWSFNCRLSYFGGIFVNVFRVDPLTMVESLIHEYYHQRFWQWWAYEPLEEMPGEEVLILSYMTGEMRSFPVMTQALIIYTGILDYYIWCRENSYFSDDALHWINLRIRKIYDSIPSIYNSLCRLVRSKSPPRQLIDFNMDQFNKICALHSGK